MSDWRSILEGENTSETLSTQSTESTQLSLKGRDHTENRNCVDIVDIVDGISDVISHPTVAPVALTPEPQKCQGG